jgi:NCAIR mutase (PurE)-related protein
MLWVARGLQSLPGNVLRHGRRRGLLRARDFGTSGGGEPVRQLLERIALGVVSVDEALGQMRALEGSFDSLAEYAKIDHDRAARTGIPEVVFGEGKSAEQIVRIMELMADRRPTREEGQHTRVPSLTSSPSLGCVTYSSGPAGGAALGASGVIMASRVSRKKFEKIQSLLRKPGHEGSALHDAEYFPVPRILALRGPTSPEPLGCVAVVCAGTSDLSVAEEVAVTAELSGAKVSEHRTQAASCACYWPSPGLTERGGALPQPGAPPVRCGRGGDPPALPVPARDPEVRGGRVRGGHGRGPAHRGGRAGAVPRGGRAD